MGFEGFGNQPAGTRQVQLCASENSGRRGCVHKEVVAEV